MKRSKAKLRVASKFNVNPLSEQPLFCTSEYRFALALAPATVSLNNQPLRLWAPIHKRNNANRSLMRTRLRRRAIPPSVEAPTATLLLRMITVTAGTASTPWAGGSELA